MKNFLKNFFVKASLYLSGASLTYYWYGNGHWIFVIIFVILLTFGLEYFNKWFKLKDET